MNIFLWVLQIIMGGYFITTAFMHFTLPPDLPGPMTWMYELPIWLHYLSGSAELLGGLGLILPGLAKVQPRLTPLAAAGLVLVMSAAMIYHITQSEFQNLFMNIVLGALLAVIAYRRWGPNPLPERNK